MQLSDDLYLGPAFSGGANAPGPSPMELGVGPMGRVFVFDVTPLTLQAAGLATSQNPGSGAAFTLTAGTGVTASTDSAGVTRYTLDVPRSVSITATGANTATYLVSGYDQYGQPMSQTVAAPSTSTVKTTKMFKQVTSVVNNNATASTNGVTVGYGDDVGLPVRLTDLGYVVSMMYNGAAVTVNSTNVGVADATAPATTSTTDVRGYIKAAGFSGGNNGTKRLVMTIAVPAIGCGPNATRVGAFGVTQA